MQTAGPSSQAWTTRSLLGWMAGFFESRDLDAPRVVAEMLLAHVLGCDRMRLYMEADRPASPDELNRLRALVARAGRHEPVHYLTGEATFYWRSFRVSPVTLIPQPCTETLVDHVIDHFRGLGLTVLPARDAAPEGEAEAPAEPDTNESVLIADVGTGCGCIAVSLACQIPSATVVATDLEDEVLELAASNARRYGVAGRIDFRRGPGVEPLAAAAKERGRRFDAICANPPYVPDDEVATMDPAVREHVPRRAWSGGPDGLAVIRPLIERAPPLLAPGGLLAVEIAHRHGEVAIELARRAGLGDVRVLEDQDGLPRVVVSFTPPPPPGPRTPAS